MREITSAMTEPATSQGHSAVPPAQLPPEAGPATAGALSKSNQLKREELLGSIRALPPRLVVVTGTGVTFQSVGHPAPGSDVAGWPGLLAHGLERCRKLNLIDDSDAAIVALQIENKKCENLLDAAQKIHECLAKRTNERKYWMKEAIGSLRVNDSRLIRAILALNGLVTTLNYDDTIHQVSGRPALHWRQQNEITKRIRDQLKDFTLHLHGLYEDLDSIVLDRKSYYAIRHDVQMQDLLRSFARFETMLFIGCRQTFLDPNFQALLTWAQIGLLGLEHRHFVLCRASEETDIVSELQPHGYLTPLVYGEQHSDLAPFLEALAIEARGAAATVNPPTLSQAPAGAAAPANVLKPGDIWKRHSRR
jgi:hypothetical protein